ncbi:hypothetical protein FH608_048145 [Nonomuraea phyllanthi]|uniref:Uncharacterized protein n=1 Tax=Nonomuraea phyllanthi TaxID=2219224 RepID=A0A5C4V3E2_9ACTN|nr:hypothetical protein [Nonomuraea phyllanthi]KAB8184745.1 hypothetical protein FH608_048145 [Nonomuraea phyllanthi]
MRYRLDPADEAEAARGNLLGGLYTGGVAALAHAYRSGWGPELNGYVEIPRDSDLFPLLSAGAGLICALFTVALTVRVVRWQIALSQRRQARDPVKALLLPPSAGHGAALRRSRPGRATLSAVLTLGVSWVAFPLVIVGLGILLTPERMGPRQEEAIVFASVSTVAGLVLLVVVGADVARRRLLAGQVRRLSQDPAFAELMPPTTAALSRYHAPVIPELKITHYAPPNDIIFGLPKVSTTRNIFGRPPLNIAYFRLFENELRMRDFVKGAFRRCGYVHLLRSAASVRQSELVRMRRAGTLGKLFVASDQRMRRELDARSFEALPRGFRIVRETGGRGLPVWDLKGGYPMSAYLCHGAYWKRAVDTLLDLADLVVIDLSGFQKENIGTGYELQRVIDRYPVHRVVVLADTGSDTDYLATHIRHAWSRMAPGSPNAGRGTRTLLVGRVPVGGHRATYHIVSYAHKRLTR